MRSALTVHQDSRDEKRTLKNELMQGLGLGRLEQDVPVREEGWRASSDQLAGQAEGRPRLCCTDHSCSELCATRSVARGRDVTG